MKSLVRNKIGNKKKKNSYNKQKYIGQYTAHFDKQKNKKMKERYWRKITNTCRTVVGEGLWTRHVFINNILL